MPITVHQIVIISKIQILTDDGKLSRNRRSFSFPSLMILLLIGEGAVKGFVKGFFDHLESRLEWPFLAVAQLFGSMFFQYSQILLELLLMV
jgi:hypothetical protein